jgi:hypothetical protein
VRSIRHASKWLALISVCVGLALSSAAHDGAAAPMPNHAPLVVRVDDGGFCWGDAGIGAAAGFGVGLVLSGSLVLAGRRDRVVARPSDDKEGQS